jgi:hypothetical protein
MSVPVVVNEFSIPASLMCSQGLRRKRETSMATLAAFKAVSWRHLDGALGPVAQDGIVQHYTPFRIPANGIFLNPKSDLATSVARC